MKRNNPISIVLACYNGDKYIKEQLNSIEQQKNVYISELIIIDDNSTDNSLIQIKSFIKSSDLNIKLFTNEINLGVNKTFEKGVIIAKENLIALCDQDDIWSDLKLYHLKTTLLSNNCDIIFNKSFLFPASEKIYNERRIMRNDSLFCNKYRGASTMFTKSFINSIIPFSNYQLYDKSIYFYCLLNEIKYEVFGKPLDFYRIHDNNVIKKSKINEWAKRKRNFKNRVLFYKELKEKYTSNNSNYNLILDFYFLCSKNNNKKLLKLFLKILFSERFTLFEKKHLIKEAVLYSIK